MKRLTLKEIRRAGVWVYVAELPSPSIFLLFLPPIFLSPSPYFLFLLLSSSPCIFHLSLPPLLLSSSPSFLFIHHLPSPTSNSHLGMNDYEEGIVQNKQSAYFCRDVYITYPAGTSLLPSPTSASTTTTVPSSSKATVTSASTEGIP